MKRSFYLRARAWLSVSLLALLAACGGGGGGGSGTTAAPSNLSYSTPQTLPVSQAITAMLPTVTGTVSLYSVTPTLPAGLSLNSSSGVISGTPMEVTSGATYTVSASNAAGSTSANVTIAVNDLAPVISYEKTAYNFTTLVSPSVVANNTGGSSGMWSISPALPDGLIFSSTSGAIGGTPLAASNPTTYVVTAQNSGGSDTFELTISVDAGGIFDLGHSAAISVLNYAGNRVLSQDASGHWVLWNRQTAAQVMQGNVLCSSSSCEDTNLAGSTLVVGKQIRSAVDGSLRATLTVPGAQCWWKLATDGSYIAYGCDNGLYVWDSNGASLLTRTGEYTFSQALAAPTELRVAARRAAPQVLEKISIPGAVSADFTFLGEFRSWFADGERFLTVDGSNTVRVYGASGGAPQPQDTRVLASVEGLAGVGNYFYAKRALRYLDIYSVGASASPAASYDFVTAFTAVPSATTVGALTISGVSVIDLAGVAPVKVDFASPVASDIYSATSPTDWVIGNREGVVADVATSPGAPRYFGFGDALDVVAGEQFFAVATASGRIVYFDSSTLDQEGVIDFFARKLELSADGTVLAAGTIGDNGQYYRTDRTLKIFSLPSGTEVRSWPATDTDAQLPWDFTLSASGDVVGRVLRALGAFDFTREVSAVAGGAPSWSDTLSLTSPLGLTGVDLPIRLSPSGAVIAVPDGFARPESITRLISSADGSVIAQAQGWIGGFVDENRLLLAIGRGNPRQAPSALFSTTTGQQLDVLDGFYGFEFQTVDADRIYNNSRIYSLTSKQFTWISDTQGLGGGVTPTHAVFKAGASIRAEVY